MYLSPSRSLFLAGFTTLLAERFTSCAESTSASPMPVDRAVVVSSPQPSTAFSQPRCTDSSAAPFIVAAPSGVAVRSDVVAPPADSLLISRTRLGSSKGIVSMDEDYMVDFEGEDAVDPNDPPHASRADDSTAPGQDPPPVAFVASPPSTAGVPVPATVGAPAPSSGIVSEGASSTSDTLNPSNSAEGDGAAEAAPPAAAAGASATTPELPSLTVDMDREALAASPLDQLARICEDERADLEKERAEAAEAERKAEAAKKAALIQRILGLRASASASSSAAGAAAALAVGGPATPSARAAAPPAVHAPGNIGATSGLPPRDLSSSRQ